VENTTKATTIALALLAVAACAARPRGEVMLAGVPAGASAGIAELRAATTAFRDLDAAVAAGYSRTVAACIVHEHHGAMGYHHVNRALMDRVLDPAKPEILLYERTPAGEYRLTGAEFIVPFRVWPRDSVAPVFMGQVLKREENLKYWYLHAWAWKANPDGVFADFHPGVRCDGKDAQVYRPT
jgi:hypothetical protein